jgi:hypothetical protein
MRLVNLCELRPSDAKQISKASWDSPDQIIAYLEKHGYSELGGGFSAITFTQPGSNAIIKVSTRDDICWVEFAKYVEKNPNNHYPKIKQLKLYTNSNKNALQGSGNLYFVCFIERLQAIQTAQKDELTLLAAAMIEILKNLGSMHDIHFWEQHLSHIRKNNQLDYNKIRNLSLKFRKTYPNFEQAIVNLKQIRSKGCSWDLHPGNIMWRPSNSMWVITDPLT